jgi:pilus assembly protein CpaB
MRAKKMMLLVVAVGCGLVASIGVSQYMENASGSGTHEVETIKIFVAITDVGVGEKLDAQNVMLEEWPKDRVPEGAIFELDELDDQFTRTRLYSGEPIMAAKLMNANGRGSESITIPSGFRVISVPVTLESAVSGLLQPGDRVDLIVFFRRGPEIPETGTRTLLRNINVGVDGATDRSIDDNGRTRNLKTVSLLVTPKQAEIVMLGQELGSLSISLRRPDEESEYISDGETVRSILGESSETANERTDPSEDNGPGLATWLNQQDAGPQPAAASEPLWEIVILSGTGYRKFEWTDAAELPTEVLNEGKLGIPPPSAMPAAAAAAAAAQAVGGLQGEALESADED